MFVCVCTQVTEAKSPILRETLLTNMTNDVAGNDAAYCSIGKKVERFLIFCTKGYGNLSLRFLRITFWPPVLIHAYTLGKNINVICGTAHKN